MTSFKAGVNFSVPLLIVFGTIYCLHHSLSIISPERTSGGFLLFSTVVTAIQMEFLAREFHKNAWHSRALWWLHGTHHNQYPSLGSKPEFHHNNPYVSPFIELNDIFAFLFATPTIYTFYILHLQPPSLFKDGMVGVCLGITLYGISYFIGHDLIAHERAGKTFAEAMKACSPYLRLCCEYHRKYHHKLADRDDDPYNTPYGFWFGPSEVDEERGRRFYMAFMVFQFAKYAFYLILGFSYLEMYEII